METYAILLFTFGHLTANLNKSEQKGKTVFTRKQVVSVLEFLIEFFFFISEVDFCNKLNNDL